MQNLSLFNINGNIRQLVGKDRVLFGSDSDAHDQAWELGRYLSMPLPDEDLIPGLGANIRKIFGKCAMQRF